MPVGRASPIPECRDHEVARQLGDCQQCVVRYDADMNCLRLIPIMLALSAAVCTVMAADEKVATEIDVLRGSYQRSAKAALKPSDDKYLAGLDALYKRYTKDANLEASMQVRNEIAFTNLGGIWKWHWKDEKQNAYLSIHRDLTVMDARVKNRGTWESTDKGIRIKWENSTTWDVFFPGTDGQATGRDSLSIAYVFIRD